MKRESLSGLLLIACAILAMVISNSPFGPVYDHWLQAPLPAGTHMSLLHWINDAVMAVFFFVVGAEVKREFLYGELKSRSAAMLPMAAALGGMLVPAAIYSVFNAGLPTAGGWGIPMATDIAFSLGVLSLAAPRAPRSLVVFLTALAIVDDLGGIVVIAVFYAGALNAPALAGGLVVWLLMLAACRRNWQQPWLYAAGGILIWLAFFYGASDHGRCPDGLCHAGSAWKGWAGRPAAAGGTRLDAGFGFPHHAHLRLGQCRYPPRPERLVRPVIRTGPGDFCRPRPG